MLIGVEDSFFWTVLIGFIVSSIGCVAVFAGAMLHWFVLTPRDARQLKKAKSKHWPINLLFFDEGFCEIVAAKKDTAEIMENPDESLAILPSKPSVLELTKEEIVAVGQAGMQMTEAQKLGVLAEFASVQRATSEIGTKRFFLRSVGVPVWIQYAPKSIAMNAQTLATIQEGKPLKGLTSLNPLIIKEFFERLWQSNKIEAIKRRGEEVGARKAKALIGKWEKWMPLFILIALIGLVLGLGVTLKAMSG